MGPVTPNLVIAAGVGVLPLAALHQFPPPDISPAGGSLSSAGTAKAKTKRQEEMLSRSPGEGGSWQEAALVRLQAVGETGRSSQNSCWGSGRPAPVLPGAERALQARRSQVNSLPKVYEGFNEL